MLCVHNGSLRSIFHQLIRFPLLRRPSFYQCSILRSSTNARIQRVSPFYRTSQFAGSEEIDFRVWFPPGLSDAVDGSTSGVLSLHRETKFIIDFDFAVTLSSPDSFCVLFDITSEHSAELKWLILPPPPRTPSGKNQRHGKKKKKLKVQQMQKTFENKNKKKHYGFMSQLLKSQTKLLNMFFFF